MSTDSTQVKCHREKGGTTYISEHLLTPRYLKRHKLTIADEPEAPTVQEDEEITEAFTKVGKTEATEEEAVRNEDVLAKPPTEEAHADDDVVIDEGRVGEDLPEEPYADDTPEETETEETPLEEVSEEPDENADEPEAPTKGELLDDLLTDGKINAVELIKWIKDCDNIDHIAIVMDGEERKTVTDAANERIKELG